MPTNRVSLDEIISRRRLSADSNGNLYKAVVLEEKAKGFDKASRSQRFVMSSESKDLYGDIVRQTGLDATNFEKNPVGLAYHDHRAPIGKWSDLQKVGGKSKRTEGTLTLFAEGTSEKADEIGRLLEIGGLRACSIGFSPVEGEWILDEEGRNTYGIDFTKSILLECSVCSVPANPDALAKAAGGDMKLAAEMFERILDTYCEEKMGGLFVRKEFADAYLKMKGNPVTHAVPGGGTGGIDGIGLAEANQEDEQMAEMEKQVALEVTLDTAEAEKKVDSLLQRLKDGIAAIFGHAEEKAAEMVAREEPEEPAKEIEVPAGPAFVKGSRAKAKAATAKLRAKLQAKGHLK